MKGDAIKALAGKAAANTRPSDEEIGLAIAEGVDILLAFFADVGRIADAAEKVAECADGVHPSAFRVIPQT